MKQFEMKSCYFEIRNDNEELIARFEGRSSAAHDPYESIMTLKGAIDYMNWWNDDCFKNGTVDTHIIYDESEDIFFEEDEMGERVEVVAAGKDIDGEHLYKNIFDCRLFRAF